MIVAAFLFVVLVGNDLLEDPSKMESIFRKMVEDHTDLVEDSSVIQLVGNDLLEDSSTTVLIGIDRAIFDNFDCGDKS